MTTYELPGITLSALEARPQGAEALATVIALHGGGYSAAYWDSPLDPRGSLLRLGASLGYHVIAVDRPGIESAVFQDCLNCGDFAARRTVRKLGSVRIAG